MSKDYKLYHRYLQQQRSKETTRTKVHSTESSGSGQFPFFSTTATALVDQVYSIKERTYSEIEQTFKKEYPLQYLQAKEKFNKKLKKLLEANEQAMEGLLAD